MYKRIIIIGYKLGSASVRALATYLRTKTKLKVLRVDKNSKTYKNKPTDYVINWGLSLWRPDHTVAHVQNKLYFFRYIQKHNNTHTDYTAQQISIPEWTEDINTAQDWHNAGQQVVCRTLLTSHSGKGIVLTEVGDNEHGPITALLYVKYKKKKSEFRVHVFNGQVIDVTQKKKRKDFEGEVNTKIRNHQNGWVYCREGITEPNDLRSQAVLAATTCGIKHGAVDVIYNEKENKCYILEINSAPGIEGTTLEKYSEAFLKDMKNEV